jgi:hypothetical protein
MAFTNEGGTLIITGEKDTRLARLITLKAALGLECKGMKIRRGFSAYATIKKEFGLKGNKASVLIQFTGLVEQKKQERLAETAETPA